MIGIIIRYRHLIGYGIAALSVLLLLWYIHHKGYEACKNDALIKSAEISEKRNEILNNRPDNDKFLDGLLKHSKSWQ